MLKLKEYYEIVDEDHSTFFPTHAETLKLSKLPYFRMIRGIIALKSTFDN